MSIHEHEKSFGEWTETQRLGEQGDVAEKGTSIPQMELNEKVAKLCGLTHDDMFNRWYGWMKDGKYVDFPDYCNDLNACAEFEKGLTEEQVGDYLYELESGPRPAAFATAEQRCRAFIALHDAQEGPRK